MGYTIEQAALEGQCITFSIFIFLVGRTYDEIKWDSDQALVNTSGLFMDIGYWLLQGAINDPNYYSGCSGFKHQSPSASDKMSAVASHWGNACPFYCEKSGKIEKKKIFFIDFDTKKLMRVLKPEYLSKSSAIQAWFIGYLSSVY